MWEKTRHGKRSLKSDAAPTIFGEHILTDTIKQEVQESTQIELITEIENQMSESNANTTDEILLQQISFWEDNETSKVQERLLRLENVLDATEKSRLRFNKELYAAKRIQKLDNEIVSLQKNTDTGKLSESVNEILNDDQNKILTKTDKKITHCGNKTLTNTYKLRYACKTSGYKEICLLPYPSTKKNW